MEKTDNSFVSAKWLWFMAALAALEWTVVFQPWRSEGSGKNGFWIQMTMSVLFLAFLAFVLHKGLRRDVAAWFRHCAVAECAKQLLLGVLVAAALWGVFWVGDRLSSLMFDFARPQVELVYGLKNDPGMVPWAIPLLLILLIGPAEELFWRGFVQRSFGELWGNRFRAFMVTAVIYALIHLCSLNFMLVMAAFVAGLVWGFLYWLKPSWLPALVISHALWDAAVFVWFPI